MEEKAIWFFLTWANKLSRVNTQLYLILLGGKSDISLGSKITNTKRVVNIIHFSSPLLSRTHCGLVFGPSSSPNLLNLVVSSQSPYLTTIHIWHCWLFFLQSFLVSRIPSASGSFLPGLLGHPSVSSACPPCSPWPLVGGLPLWLCLSAPSIWFLRLLTSSSIFKYTHLN